MERFKYIAFVYADCVPIMSAEDLQILDSNFEKYGWETRAEEKYSTFHTPIRYDPLMRMISSGYRPHKPVNSGLKKYLPVATIETLSYFEYFGEKTYGCIKQLPLDSEEEEEEEREVANAIDIHKLMDGINTYLETNNIGEHHDITKQQVGRLKLMSGIAQKYNLEIGFFDENYPI